MKTLSVLTLCTALAMPGLASAAVASQPSSPGKVTPVATQAASPTAPASASAKDKLREEACTKEARTKHVAPKDRHEFMKSCMARRDQAEQAPKPGTAKELTTPQQAPRAYEQ